MTASPAQQPPAAEPPIAVLVAPPAQVDVDDPRTGEPRRPWLITASAACSWLASAALGVGLLVAYWTAVTDFAHATWLMGRFVTGPGSLERVLLSVAVTAIGLVIGSFTAITGYYAWAGYRWSRVWGLIGAGLSFGALTLNTIAWVAVPSAVVGALLLWLPPAQRFFDAWRSRRHSELSFADPFTTVAYGPLPRYR